MKNIRYYVLNQSGSLESSELVRDVAGVEERASCVIDCEILPPAIRDGSNVDAGVMECRAGCGLGCETLSSEVVRDVSGGEEQAGCVIVGAGCGLGWETLSAIRVTFWGVVFEVS